MAAFPVLKSGAVAQYPSSRSSGFSTVVREFVDGSEQRFGRYRSALRRWEIRLERLDDAELFELEHFFLQQSGAQGSFTFTDPWDGNTYADCSFEGDDLELIFEDVRNGTAVVVVRENR